MTEFKPGDKVLWKHTRHHFTTWKAGRVIKLTPHRVVIMIRAYPHPTRRAVKADRLKRPGQ